MNGDAEVVTLTDDGTTRATYAEVGERVDRLCRGLRELGVGDGDRVATFAWNSQHHLEVYLAAPCMGAVLHTLNIRLFPEQLVYVVNHAEDKVILVDGSLVDALAQHVDKFETVEHFVVMGDGDLSKLPNAISYEELLERQEPGFDYPEIDDRAAAGLCYTSGTTGNPKGVLYSHRSNILHAMGQCLADAIGVSRSDRILPVVPMFHANAWGLPYGACMAGASLIMPNRFLQAEPIARLIEGEKVTLAGAVPTIWLDLLRWSDEHKPDLSSLRMVICGGSAVPLALMKAFEERHGVRITQAWGMTETSPVGSVAHPPEDAEGDEHWAYRATAGRLAPLVEARLVDDGGEEVAWDGESTGELQVRGPWIAATYYEDPDAGEKFDDGWLRTGDVASIDGQRLHPHLRPLEGRHQVRRRVDLLRRPRERADGPRRDRRGGRDRQARRALVGAPARVRRARGGSGGVCLRPPGAPRVARGQVVDPRRVRLHRRSAEDERRQVRQEGPPQAPRGGRAGDRQRIRTGVPIGMSRFELNDLPVRHADAAVRRPAGDRPGWSVPWMPMTPPPGQPVSWLEYALVPNAHGP